MIMNSAVIATMMLLACSNMYLHKQDDCQRRPAAHGESPSPSSPPSPPPSSALILLQHQWLHRTPVNDDVSTAVTVAVELLPAAVKSHQLDLLDPNNPNELFWILNVVVACISVDVLFWLVRLSDSCNIPKRSSSRSPNHDEQPSSSSFRRHARSPIRKSKEQSSTAASNKSHQGSLSASSHDKSESTRWREFFAVMAFLICPLVCMMASIFLVVLAWRLFGDYRSAMAVIVALSAFTYGSVYLSDRGGMSLSFARSSSFWKLFCGYFPVSVISDTDTAAPDDPRCKDRPVLFGVHPHGIIALGAIAAFANDVCAGSGRAARNPAAAARITRISLLTLSMNFVVPVWGYILAALGVASSSKACINNVLSRGAGHAVALVIGGAKESLDAHPGIYRLTLKRRKGFIKMALLNGASLVPVISFGENSTFDQSSNQRGSIVRLIQDSLQRRFGVAFPLLRSLPKQTPITVVIGAPIPVPLTNKDDISEKLVDEYHSLYVNQLKAMFQRNRHLDVIAAQELELVDH